jgi:hypothetical protein
MRHTRHHNRAARTRAKAAAAAISSVIVVAGAADVGATSHDTRTELSAPSDGGEESQPIIVTDAYHGIGVMVCRTARRLVKIADSYHGVGIAVCVKS